MLTNSWRRLRSPAVWTFVLVLGLPALAQAQQGGLFPLHPIKRERTPCQMEDPVYRLYRHEYFGYHPTCWRRFPAGWGCPSPEAPNPEASYRETPRDVTPPGEDRGEVPPAEGDALPGGPGATNPNPNPNANPLPPLPSGERSPFDLDRKPETSPAPRSPVPAPVRPTPEAGPSLPSLPPASTDPAPPPAPPAPPMSRIEPGNAPAANGPTAPLLATSEPPLPDPSQPNAGAFNPGTVEGPPTAPFAPQRRSLIGGLFNGLSWRRR